MTAADRFLLAEVRRGNADGWAQLVSRYQGRLVAFARSQLRNSSESEDVVQETFLSFLQSLPRYREEASLETYLFTLLRRRIVDHLRKRGAPELSSCSLHETMFGGEHDQPLVAQLADDQRDAGNLAIEREELSAMQRSLASALEQFVTNLQNQEKFRDLQIMELIFYAQLRNKQIAELLNMDEKQVALRKFRMIEKLAEAVDGAATGNAQAIDDTMLTRTWEFLRPSCPKRSTLGKLVLGALDGPWQDYVTFHLEQLGCRFCQANRADLQLSDDGYQPGSAFDRIMESSIGFFRPLVD